MLSFLLFILAVQSADADTQTTRINVCQTTLLVIESKSTDSEAQYITKLIQEIEMVLECVIVKRLRARPKFFDKQALKLQVNEGRRLIKEHKAIVAVWLSQPVPQSIALHLLVRKEQQYLVRTIDVKATNGAAVTLALAVRELLAAHQLLPVPMSSKALNEPSHVSLSTKPSSKTSNGNEAKTEIKSNVDKNSPSFNFAIKRFDMTFGAERGVYDYKGSHLVLNTGIATVFGHTPMGLSFRLGCEGKFGPWQKDTTVKFNSTGAKAIMGVELPHQIGTFWLALESMIQLQWQIFQVKLNKTSIQRYQFWGIRTVIGPHLSRKIFNHWRAGLVFHLGWQPLGAKLHKLSDDTKFWTTPRLDASIMLSIEYLL